MAGTRLLPGFRFHPTDEELIMYYLKRKVMGKKSGFEVISELNINKFSPWDLPDKSCLKSKDLEWYFFCPRERKYASGTRMKRATEGGYWKTTGRDRPVVNNERVVGMVKTLVFYVGSAPRGERTDWMIYEYRIVDKQLEEAGIAQDAYVLCKVFQKNGAGPKNGAQYGAPFKEEEWDDDDDLVDHNGTFPCSGASATAPTVHLHQNASSSVVTSMGGPQSTSVRSLSEPGPSFLQPPVDVMHPGVPDDDILHLLDLCTENGPPFPDQIYNNEKMENVNEIYNGLGDLDLGSWQTSGDCGHSVSALQEAGPMLSPDFPMLSPDFYLELNDLEPPLELSAEAEGRECVPASNQGANNNSFPF